jgi:3-oxoacyl-[acyl-carrier-protein] synthase-3
VRMHGLTLDEVAMVVPHQPSIRVLKRTAEVLEIPFAKMRTNMDKYANTAGATVPLLLDQLNCRGALAPGQMLLFAAVGSGWTWGAALYRWQ